MTSIGQYSNIIIINIIVCVLISIIMLLSIVCHQCISSIINDIYYYYRVCSISNGVLCVCESVLMSSLLIMCINNVLLLISSYQCVMYVMIMCVCVYYYY